MIKYSTTKGSTMIGKIYPFFQNNINFKNSHLLYEIYSPKLSDDCTPLISLNKLSEKSREDWKKPSEKKKDPLLASIMPEGYNSVDYVSNLIKRDHPEFEEDCKDGEFPAFKISDNNSAQKNLIISIRDSLRWKQYKFYPGRYIDMLYSPTKFLILEIKGDKEKDMLWLEPVALYNNTDVSLTKPLKVDVTKLEFPKDIFSGKLKISEMNIQIKRYEWNSFTRRG